MNKLWSLVASLATAGAFAPVQAQSLPDQYLLAIDQQPLVATLKEFSRQTGLQVVGMIDSSQDAHRIVGPLKGTYTAEAAMVELLDKSELVFKRINRNTIAVAKRDVASRETSHRSGPQNSFGEAGYTLVADRRWVAPEAAGEGGSSAVASGPTAASGEAGESQGLSDTSLPEEVIVTGTHIYGVDPAGSKVTTLTREEIDRSGYGRLQDVMATMTQTFKGASEEFSQGVSNVNFGADIQLRGLGPGTTLTLVNGLRQASGGSKGAFTDVSNIPLAAIERVEILADGASAIYGSDAIGGVANIILRRDFEGAETRLRFGSADGDAEEIVVSQVFGTSWSSGNALLGYQYYNRDSLAAADREYTSRNGNMTSYGGTDFRQSEQRYQSGPGTILCPAGRPGCVAGQPAFAIPTGQDGSNLEPSDLIPGVANYTDAVSRTEILPQQEMHSVFVNASQALTDHWTITGNARFNTRDASQDAGERKITVNVPSTNAFYVNAFGNGAPIRVAYDLAQDMGPTRSVAQTETYNVAVSLEGQLTQDWRVRFIGAYNEEDAATDTDFVNVADPAVLAALNAALADPNPATALNVFGDGAHNNPATLARLRSTALAQGISNVWNAGVILDGAIFELPGGNARLAFGADYREEEQQVITLTRNDTDARDVTAAFAELSIPIVGAANARPGLHRLNVSMAARHEEYSDFGSSLDPRVGVTWKPINELALRGTWGTSFRAPPFYLSNVAFGGGASALAAIRPDPRSPTGTSKVITLLGNNSDLTEETATVWTAGFDLALPFSSGLTLSGTYFDVSYRDKIQVNAVNLAQEAQFAELITRNPTPEQVAAICGNASIRLTGDCSGSIGAILDSRVRNVAQVDTSGIDLSINQNVPSTFGTWNIQLGGTYTLEYERALTASAPRADIIDTVGNQLALRLRGGINWVSGPWSAGAMVHHTGRYRDPTSILSPRVDSLTTVDLNVALRIAEGSLFGNSQLSISAVNVTDELPPFVDQPDGYDGANGTLMGRLLSMQLVKTF